MSVDPSTLRLYKDLLVKIEDLGRQIALCCDRKNGRPVGTTKLRPIPAGLWPSGPPSPQSPPPPLQSPPPPQSPGPDEEEDSSPSAPDLPEESDSKSMWLIYQFVGVPNLFVNGVLRLLKEPFLLTETAVYGADEEPKDNRVTFWVVTQTSYMFDDKEEWEKGSKLDAVRKSTAPIIAVYFYLDEEGREKMMKWSSLPSNAEVYALPLIESTPEQNLFFLSGNYVVPKNTETVDKIKDMLGKMKALLKE